MKVKILAGEYLFSEQGIRDKADHVKALLTADRLNRGLDSDGNLIPAPVAAPVVEEPAPVVGDEDLGQHVEEQAPTAN